MNMKIVVTLSIKYFLYELKVQCLNNEHGPNFHEACVRLCMLHYITVKGYRVIVFALFHLHMANVRFGAAFTF
jgi:hypothetical protein